MVQQLLVQQWFQVYVEEIERNHYKLELSQGSVILEAKLPVVKKCHHDVHPIDSEPHKEFQTAHIHFRLKQGFVACGLFS